MRHDLTETKTTTMFCEATIPPEKIEIRYVVFHVVPGSIQNTTYRS